MALFDIFTGDPAKEAAQQQRQYLTGIMGDVNQRFGTASTGGLEALRAGQAGALDAYGRARGDITGASPQALNALFGGRDLGVQALQAGQVGGLAALDTGVGRAAGSYDPLMAAGGRYGGRAGVAADEYEAAMGLRGGGYGGFQTSPGYRFALQQGLEGIVRNANVGGMAAGGNQIRAATEYATNAANQEYQRYLDNLFKREQLYSPLEERALAGGGAGRAQAYLTGGTGAANIYTGTGGRLSDLYGSTGAGAANIYTGQGVNLANLSGREAGVYGETGRSIADLLSQTAGRQAQFAGQFAPNIAGTYGAEAQAEMDASKNIWGAGLAAAQLAAGMPPVGMGGGTNVFGLTSSSPLAKPYYAANYSTPQQLFPNYSQQPQYG